MALGPDLFPTVVKWVVIFELLVKKIGCDDMETWGAHLRVINFFFFLLAFAKKLQSLVIMMQLSVTLQQKHAFSEMKVHICNGHDGTLPSVLPHAKMHQDMCQVKSVIQYELAPDDSSVITSCASHSTQVWTAFWSQILSVKVGLSSVSLPLVTDHFDFLETDNKTVVNQYSLMQGEENQFVLNYTAITASHPLPAQRVSLPKRMGLL